MWVDNLFLWNKAKALASDVFHEIYPYNEKDIVPLLGILNSTITAFLLELHDRSYGGGVLKIQVYELKNLAIPDLNKLEHVEKRRVEKAFLNLIKARNKDAMLELDNAVFNKDTTTRTN